MADPFVGEIRMASFGFAPQGWAQANGQFLPINQNQALFSLLGTTFGGNGQTNFQLPDLRGRVPIHMGSGFTLGERSGQEAVTLVPGNLPTHNHQLNAVNSPAALNVGTGAFLAQRSATYGAFNNLVNMSPAEVGFAGQTQAHQNMQPYTVINFLIALIGVFPSQN